MYVHKLHEQIKVAHRIPQRIHKHDLNCRKKTDTHTGNFSFFFLNVVLHTNRITVVIYPDKAPLGFPAATDRKLRSGSVGDHCSVRKNNSEGG